MTRVFRAIAARRARLADDSGASLVLALIFITVVAVVMGVVLSFAETNLRTTRALRSQAATASAADGAAKAAIDRITGNTYDLQDGSNCFGSGSTLTLPNFYTDAGVAGSAMVECQLDGTNSDLADVNSHNRPANALTVLGRPGTIPDNDAIYAKINGTSSTMKVKGGVVANADVNIFHGTLNAIGGTQARGTCSGNITPTACTNPGVDAVAPVYSTPPAPVVDRTDVPTCQTNPANPITFEPGLYTDWDKLNKAMSCKNKLYHFKPGNYFFDFDGVWKMVDGNVIGGKMTGNYKNSTNITNLAGACVSPVPPDDTTPWTHPDTDDGVTFVFGRKARLLIENDAQVALCGRYREAAPPIVIQGLMENLGYTITSPVSKQRTGTMLGRQTNATNCVDSFTCALITTDKNANDFKAHILGTVYAPQDWVDLSLKKELEFYFHAGVIVNRFSVDGTGNTLAPTPMFAIPEKSPAPSRTVVWLKVYLCPGSGTCTAGAGQKRLLVKVNITDSRTNARGITVLNWSVQR
ncbi:hypothetical protein GCM10009682_60310 [Luedemannella flava]|uniref:Flp pilus-assembly TadG-like N-terminal domain-containing protein n=1 Tax=Luedemannella flava TaxID=349316 RepID=A0ABN2MQE2_9ACTN